MLRASCVPTYESDSDIERLVADWPVVFPVVTTPIEELVDVETADHFSARKAVSNVAVPASAAQTPAPKKRRSSAKRPRKSKERDARNGRTMERLDPCSSTNRKRASVAAPSTPSSLSTTTPIKPKNKRQKANDRDRRLLPAWRYTGDIIRMKTMTRAVEELGIQAFSLNLSSDVEAAALKTPLKAKIYMHDRIKKAFKRYFGIDVDFAFVLEFTPAGRLHIHGIIVVDQEHKKLATQALMEAGGKWDAAHPEFQADVRKLWCGDGWANYVDKTSSRTRKILGLKDTTSILSATQNLRRVGETYWEGLRARQKRETEALRSTSSATRRSSGRAPSSCCASMLMGTETHSPARPKITL